MDFVLMTSNAYMFITGPKVVETVTGEKVTNEQLGGPLVHAQSLATYILLQTQMKKPLI